MVQHLPKRKCVSNSASYTPQDNRDHVSLPVKAVPPAEAEKRGRTPGKTLPSERERRNAPPKERRHATHRESVRRQNQNLTSMTPKNHRGSESRHSTEEEKQPTDGTICLINSIWASSPRRENPLESAAHKVEESRLPSPHPPGGTTNNPSPPPRG